MSVVEGLPFADDKKQYILSTLDPILEEMVSEVLSEMPDNPQGFMITWLQKRSGVSAASTVQPSIVEKHRQLKQELQQVHGSLSEAASSVAKVRIHESSEEEEDDELDEPPESFKKAEATMGDKKARQSVSAEAYGAWNKKKEFTAPVNAKTDEQKNRLSQTLQTNFMFSELEAGDMATISMAMKEMTFEPSTKVITEGEDGDYLFVIEKGTLECIKNIGGEDKVVKSCSAGDVFGELALLYNCPRAASVVAKDACVCWQLDRETFNHIVKDAAVKRREKYDTFLQSVNLLASLSAYERSQVADALKPEIIQKGSYVVKQGDPGDKFYIVESGSLHAMKAENGEEKRVMEYKAGEYFGELALLKNQPRAASVLVDSDSAKVLSMSRDAFTKMLGSLQDILQDAGSKYT